MVTVIPRDRFEQQTLDLIFSRVRFTEEDVVTACDAPARSTQAFLRRLISDGVLVRCGTFSGNEYFTCLGKDYAAELADESLGRPLSLSALDGLLASMKSKVVQNEIRPAEAIVPETPEERVVWDFISKRMRFTKAEVAQVCPPATARNRFLRRLELAGQIRQIGKEGGQAVYSAHTPEDTREIARDLRSTTNGAIWTAIRQQKRFRPVDLFAALSPARKELTQDRVLNYCRVLLRAGFIRSPGKSARLLWETKLVLVNNSGPLPPSEQRTTVIVDHNQERIVYAAGGRLE